MQKIRSIEIKCDNLKQAEALIFRETSMQENRHNFQGREI